MSARGVAAALLIAAGAQLALPVALRFLIDEGLAVRDAATINRYFVAFLTAAVVFGAFAALRFYLVSWLGERVVADVRNAVYAKVVRMDPTFFEVTSPNFCAPRMLKRKFTTGSPLRCWSKPGCASVRSSPCTMTCFSTGSLPSWST